MDDKNVGIVIGSLIGLGGVLITIIINSIISRWNLTTQLDKQNRHAINIILIGKLEEIQIKLAELQTFLREIKFGTKDPVDPHYATSKIENYLNSTPYIQALIFLYAPDLHIDFSKFSECLTGSYILSDDNSRFVVVDEAALENANKYLITLLAKNVMIMHKIAGLEQLLNTKVQKSFNEISLNSK